MFKGSHRVFWKTKWQTEGIVSQNGTRHMLHAHFFGSVSLLVSQNGTRHTWWAQCFEGCEPEWHTAHVACQFLRQCITACEPEWHTAHIVSPMFWRGVSHTLHANFFGSIAKFSDYVLCKACLENQCSGSINQWPPPTASLSSHDRVHSDTSQFDNWRCEIGFWCVMEPTSCRNQYLRHQTTSIWWIPLVAVYQSNPKDNRTVNLSLSVSRCCLDEWFGQLWFCMGFPEPLKYHKTEKRIKQTVNG